MFGLVTFIVLISLGYFAGRAAEHSHFARLDAGESKLSSIIGTNLKTPPVEAGQTTLVTGNAVVALDYFKSFTSSFRMFFGGRMKAYDPLLQRARREAVLRMKQEAADFGADYVYNIRIETTRIGEHAPKSIGAIEVLAYGTAIKKA